MLSFLLVWGTIARCQFEKQSLGVCCDPQRLGRFMVFVQMEIYSDVGMSDIYIYIQTETLGCLACLYSRVGEPHMLQAACPSARLMSWPLLPSVAPVPLRVSLPVSLVRSPYWFKY